MPPGAMCALDFSFAATDSHSRCMHQSAEGSQLSGAGVALDLRPYRTEASVQEVLDQYLAENGFNAADYDAPWVRIAIGPVSFPFPNPPSRQRAVRLHDLHHVATGYGTDLPGEAEISAWELRRGLKGLSAFVAMIVFNGALLGLVHSPRRTLRAWRVALSGDPSAAPKTLFAATLERDYPRLLQLTLAQLREELGVPHEGIATTRGLHSAAPSVRG